MKTICKGCEQEIMEGENYILLQDKHVVNERQISHVHNYVCLYKLAETKMAEYGDEMNGKQ